MKLTTFHLGTAVGAAVLAAACSSGQDEQGEVVLEFSVEAEASRFLARATFGATPEAVETFTTLGDERWLEQQLALPATEIVPALSGQGCFLELGDGNCPDWLEELRRLHNLRTELWWQRALYAPDQLRQRVAFALTEIFVVSERGDFMFAYPLLLADYHDMLARGAFGTYRELLKEVTLHPAMGIYLSMCKNQKPDEVTGSRPDENFAREVMQLFSIGLELLNPDGSAILDEFGRPVPTYDQDVVVGMARALTGWNFRGTPPASTPKQWDESLGLLGRMEPDPTRHDTDPKLLVGGYEAPGGLSPEEDLALVLDLLAGHPNVGPFLGRRLIQRLVTSNPSPEYIARISAVFEDDGEGVRGNLGAVVTAILTDDEARSGGEQAPEIFGKVREPILRLTALFRAFEARAQDGRVQLHWATGALNQGHLQSPSVFNFFLPDFAPIGPVGDAGLVAPELQITTHTFINRVGNFLAWMVFDHYEGSDCEGCEAPLLDYAEAAELAAHPAHLVDYLDAMLLGGTLSEGSREVVLEYLREIPYDEAGVHAPPGYSRVLEAVHLLVVSPEFSVQK